MTPRRDRDERERDRDEGDRDRDERGRPRNARPRDRSGRPLARGVADQMADRVEPDEVVDTVAEALARAATLTAQRRHFEAHEFLEWIWKSPETPPADRDFWKGVTQVVVAGVHLQRGNGAGAERLATRGLAFLRPYADGHAGVDVAALRADAEGLLAALAAGADTDGVAPPRLTLLR